jgi:hypothetical protein
MALTRDFKETIKKRIASDPDFARTLLHEAVDLKTPPNADPARRWLTTLSWPDKVIARLFPHFFKRNAPEEIQEQWAQYLGKKNPPKE